MAKKRVSVSLTHKSLISVSFVVLFNAFSPQNHSFINAASPDGYKYFQGCLLCSIAVKFSSLKPSNGPVIDYSVSFRRAFQICIVLSERIIRQYSYHVVVMFSLLLFKVQFI